MQANQRSRLVAATIELVAERGYDGTTVRGIVQLAGVSKASFYEQFSGKDECVLAAVDTALRAAATAVLTGESIAGEGRERLRAGLLALAELIAEQPQGASLLLIDGPAAPVAIREHIDRRFGLLQALVRERLTSAPGGRELPEPLVAAIVRGIAHHARRCVRTGRPDRLRDLVDPLLDWGLGLGCEQATAAFAAVAPAPGRAAAPPNGNIEVSDEPAQVDIRDLLLGATLRLAAREGYAALTPSRIRRAAGVSRRSFNANFEDATSCFLAAVESELDAHLTAAARAARAEPDWGRRTCLVFDRFAVSLAAAPDLARLAFVETLDAAPASLHWRERLLATWAAALYRGAPAGRRPTPAVAEATLAATWGLLTDLIATDRLTLLPPRGPQLALLALVPVLGTSGAAEAIAATHAAKI